MIARPCLYDETVVAEANGVIEDPGQGWTSKVAQSEGGSEQTGYKALNLKKSHEYRVKEDFRENVAQLFPRLEGQGFHLKTVCQAPSRCSLKIWYLDFMHQQL